MTDWSDDLALALTLADAADAISAPRFGALDLRVETKPDATPVTDADLAVETALRDRLATARPTDGILGEEGGSHLPEAIRQWVIDPIDGTKNFVRGVPVWGTLVALEDDGEVVVGVASAPALGRRWWAGKGLGAWATSPLSAEPRRLAVSGVADLGDAFLSASSLASWHSADRHAQFVALTGEVWRERAFGDFWSHLLVAEGAVDVAAEPEVSHWDIAPLDIIVREAGGAFTSLAGEAGPRGGSVVATNGLLHSVVLERIGIPRSG